MRKAQFCLGVFNYQWPKLKSKAKSETMYGYHDVRYIRANIWSNYKGFIKFSQSLDLLAEV